MKKSTKTKTHIPQNQKIYIYIWIVQNQKSPIKWNPSHPTTHPTKKPAQNPEPHIQKPTKQKTQSRKLPALVAEIRKSTRSQLPPLLPFGRRRGAAWSIHTSCRPHNSNQSLSNLHITWEKQNQIRQNPISRKPHLNPKISRDGEMRRYHLSHLEKRHLSAFSFHLRILWTKPKFSFSLFLQRFLAAVGIPIQRGVF